MTRAPEIEALSQTELAYAAQEALGGPYRRPIFRIKPATPTTPQMIRALWRGYLKARRPLFDTAPPPLGWRPGLLEAMWARSEHFKAQ